jgi:hypothetical protein
LVVLDLSHTESFGSLFVNVAFGASRQLRDRRGHLAICGASPFCAEVLRIVHAKQAIPAFGGRAEAIAALLALQSAPP